MAMKKRKTAKSPTFDYFGVPTDSCKDDLRGNIPKIYKELGASYHEKGTMLRTLKGLSNGAKEVEWIQLKRITEAFNVNMGKAYSTMLASEILYQLGAPFDGRKRMHDGLYVLVVYRILLNRLPEYEPPPGYEAP